MGGKGSGTKSVEQRGDELLKGEVGPELDWGAETEKAINGLLEIDSSAIVYLYRLWPAQPDQPFKGPKYISKFYGPVDIEDIRVKHGGGAYRAQIEQKQGGKRNYSAYQFYIEGAPLYETAPSNGPRVVEDELSGRMAKLEEALKAVAAKMSNGNGDRIGRLEDLKILAEIIRPKEDNTEAMMNIFKMGVELGGKAVAGGDDWASVLKEVVPSVLESLKTRPRTVILRPKKTTATVEDRPTPQPQIAQAAPEESMNLELIQILADTIRDALDYHDKPETAARYIGRLITDDDYQQLRILQPAHLDLFVEKFFPERPDSKEYISNVLNILTKEEEPK